MSDSGGSAPAGPQTADKQQQGQLVQAMLRSPLPRFYANGFAIAQTNADVSVVLLTNGQPVGVLSMSYISAKNIVIQLGKSVEDFETAIGHKIKTIEEIGEAMRKVLGDSNVSIS